MSWKHGDTISFGSLIQILPAAAGVPATLGFVIAFNGAVQTPNAIDAAHIFQVLLDPRAAADQLQGFQNLCVMLGSVIPVDVTGLSGNLVTGAKQFPTPQTTTKALAFLFNTNTDFYKNLSNGKQGNLDVLIRLRGDFLLDTHLPARAVSAEFVRADFDTGERPKSSGLCLEGGTFESWLLIKGG